MDFTGKTVTYEDYSMVVCITGPRDYENREWIERCIKRWITLYVSYSDPNILFITGECKTGVDKHAKNVILQLGHDYQGFPADWNKHGKAAGPIRNSDMKEVLTHTIAFWNGVSTGTHDMIVKAVKAMNYETTIYPTI